MRMELFLLGAQFVAAAILAWACFCRLVKTDGETRREVRWSIALLLTASGLLLGAPYLPVLMPHDVHWTVGTTPEWCWLLLLVACALVHMVTAPAWYGAIPDSLQLPRRSGASNAILPALGLALALLTVLPPVPAQAEAAQSAAGENVWALAQGQGARCLSAGGCILMTSEVAESLLAAATTGAPCRRQSWL